MRSCASARTSSWRRVASSAPSAPGDRVGSSMGFISSVLRRFLLYDRKPCPGRIPKSPTLSRKPPPVRRADRRRTSRWPWCSRFAGRGCACCCGSVDGRRSRAPGRCPGGYLEAGGRSRSRSAASWRARSTWLSCRGSSSSRPWAIPPATPTSGSSRRPTSGSCRSASTRRCRPTRRGIRSTACPRRSRSTTSRSCSTGRERLRAKLSYTNIGFALAPRSFSISELTSHLHGRARLRRRSHQPAARARAPRPARGHGRAAPLRARRRAAGRALPLPLARAGGDRPVRGAAAARRVTHSGSSSRLTSSAGAECVSAPTLMKSTPVSATARTVSSVIPPDASSSARPATSGDGLSQLVRGHVVEQQPRHARVERRAHLVERRALHLDLHAVRRALRIASRGRLTHPAGERGVVLLHEHGVVEPGAVARAAAGAHRLLLERAQAGRGLAGVEDPDACALDRPHVAGGERGHARQPAEEVERHPLRREDRGAAAGDLGQDARLAPAAVAGARAPSAGRGRPARTPPRPRPGRPAPPPRAARCAPGHAPRRARRRGS